MKFRTLHGGLLSLFLLFAFLLSPQIATANNFITELATFVRTADAEINHLYVDHPFVALPGLTVLSPEPNQLRIQDLRGVECYPQPDQLEVCGAGDTTCILLFTKSEERLPEIRLTLSFSEGLEYGGFADIDYSDDAVFPPPLTDLDEISTQNPEAPSFLISGVTRDSGAVYICFGVRAECGVDLEEFPPNITYRWEYTTASGIFCEGEYTDPRDFAGTVATPRVQFTAPLPGLTNLNVLGTETCQTVNVTNTGVNSSATGYIFTAEDFGFDEVIEINRVARNGMNLEEGEDYTVDAEGVLTANFDLSDDPLAFSDVDQIQICYIYNECYPDVDFTPTYTVVSACDGEICTGPPDVNETGTLGNTFDFPGRVVIMYDVTEVEADPDIANDGLPQVCQDVPYVFDITLTTNGQPDPLGDINDMRLTLRECVSSNFSLDRVQVLNSDGSSAGFLDPSIVSVRTEDFVNNQGVTDNNRLAGAVTVDLRQNTTVSSDGLTDDDNDGAFDDLDAGAMARLRFFYEITCTSEDAAGADVAAAGSNMDCNIRQVRVDARRGCGNRGTANQDNNTGAPTFSSSSTSSFVNGTDDLTGTLEGYNFGQFGNFNDCNPRPVRTRNIQFEYNLGANPLVTCDPGSANVATATFSIVGTSDITDDFVFTNINFVGPGGTVAITDPADTTLTYTEEGLIFTITGPDGSGQQGEDLQFTFDATLDTAYCSPIQILIFSGSITPECDGCNCDPVSTGSSTFIQGDPQDCMCDCYVDTEVYGRRISRGFTDDTRTTLVPEIDTIDPQGKNVLAGDTIELTTRFRIQDDAAMSERFANEIAGTDRDWREVYFETSFTVPDNRNWNTSDNFPALLDYQLTRLQSILLYRDGQVIDIGAGFSGLENADISQTGIAVAGFGNREGNNDFPGTGEVINPGFPNGGYTYSGGNDGSRDQLDGHRLAVQFRGDPSRNGEVSALDRFFEIIGGEFLPGDEFETVWTTVLIDNPGQVSTLDPADPNFEPELPVTFSGFFTANSFTNRDANVFSGLFERGCPQIPVAFNFFDPQISAVSQVEYEDSGCEGEIAISFTNDDPPAGWYPNEFRPITGIEQLTLDISAPYYFLGQGTYETGGIPPTPIFADSSAAVDTGTVLGDAAFAPVAQLGQVVFTDAEFADGVRPDGYANFDNGLDDVTTVGGTLPLIGVGIDNNDTLTLRLPIRRLCGDAPSPNLMAVYSWANKHLPDYEDYPYRRRTNTPTAAAFWDGKVRDNDGTVVEPDAGNNNNGTVNNNVQFYFPFQRLPDGPGDEINPHRSVGNTSNYQIINAPLAFNATTTINPGGTQIDSPGDEINTITITPDDGAQTLTGTVAITVGRGGILNEVTADGATLEFTRVLGNDTLTAYALAIPEGLAPGEAFEFDLATDLLFCAAAEICIFPIIGCSDDPEAAVAAYVAFSPNCTTQEACYQYSGGEAGVLTTIADPATIDLCESQRFSVQYFNDGTSDLGNFSPVLYIPEGLTTSNFTAQVTGGAEVPIGDPTAEPSTDAVFGTGSVFDQTEINGVFATANGGNQAFLAGQVLTIMFDGQTGCDFTSGVPLVSFPRGDAACGIDFEGDLAFSTNIDIALPEAQPSATISFDVDDQPLEVSCSEDGDALVITAANVGKAETMMAQICARLPPGVDLDLDNVNALAPAGFTVDADNITTTPINGSGDRQICFDAPALDPGGFVCLEIPFIIGDVPCGPVFIGATVISMAEVGCANPGPGDTNPCTIGVSTTEMLYFELNVVPAITANEAELSATCTSTPGLFNVDFNFDFLAESQPYNGEVNLSLFSDVDGDGELGDNDTQIGTSQSIQVNVPQDESEAFAGTFTNVPQDQICPLLLVIESLGCECSQSVLPFDNVLPTFIDDLGDNVALCPGETFTFEGICADLSYTFDPPNAGTVVVDDATGEATIALNPGFGVNSRVPLIVEGSFGACSVTRRIGVSTVPDLDFGPYNYLVCNVGTQEVDLNIPLELQEDITVEILDPVGIENPNSVEPRIRNLQESRSYDVNFTFNDGQCMGTSQLNITVQEAIVVDVNEDIAACQTGFRLDDKLTITPADATGSFQSDGDGEFTPDNEIPGIVRYIPGPNDIAAGFVRLRFNTDTPDGPCGPSVDRLTVRIQLADCGNFFWDGSQDD